MGRELKRVALDFDWPLNKVWKGFINPYHDAGICPLCNGRGEVVGHNCSVCDGRGEKWLSQEAYDLYDNWQSYEPPTGEGYQLWENVTEGSPISPVFATKDLFAGYLIGKGYSTVAVERFIEKGYAPSMAMANGRIYSDIETHNIGGE